jgi:hypothetical protein
VEALNSSACGHVVSHGVVEDAAPTCCCHTGPVERISGYQGTEEEWREECARAIRALEAATNTINEQLGDIACELEALGAPCT